MNLLQQPKQIWLTTGIGIAEYPLLAFDRALQSAKIAQYNLVKLSSILPANVDIIDSAPSLQDGAIVFAVYTFFTFKGDQRITASLAIAIPEDRTKPGVFFEHSGPDPENTIEATARAMASDAIKSRLPYNPFKIHILSATANAMETAYTSCIAAAIFTK